MKYVKNINLIKYANRFLLLIVVMLLFQNANSQNKIRYKRYTKNVKKNNSFFRELFYNETPINVDFGSLDEDVRNLQLLGKIPSNNSLIIRPYYPELTHPYDTILKLIDSNFLYKGNIVKRDFLKINLIPLSFTKKYNSDYPFGWNDGSLNYSKGLQFKINTGVNIKFLNLDLMLNPEYIKISNDNYRISNNYGGYASPISKLNFGNSAFKFNLSKLSFGISNQNFWYGAGIKSALLVSNNAPGFQHAFISTNRPIKTFLGNFQFSITSGFLKYDTSQNFENFSLRKRNYNFKERYLNTIAIVLQPFFLKNISFELERQFQNYNRLKNLNSFNRIFPVFNGLTTEQYDDKDFDQDQQIALGSRWLFEKSNSEFYMQFGWNDGKRNLRDIAMDLAHSSAYLFGFKKIYPISKVKYINFEVENLRMTQLPSYLHRNAGNWYEHGGIKEGLTNENQIIGSGAGKGNNYTIFELSYNKLFNVYGIGFTYLLHDPNEVVSSNIENLGRRVVTWKDFSYSIKIRKRFRNILLYLNSAYVFSNNFAWENGNNKTNLYFMLNTTILW